MQQSIQLFLVDDEPDITNSLSWLLDTVGLASTAFNSPVEFLRHFASCSDPCCVVLDLQMPNLTGIEVLERILHDRKQTPVIMLTGHGDVPSAVRAMKLGAFDFLMKPFNPHGFLELVNRACRKAEQAHRLTCRKREDQQALAKLSTRELQIFDGVVAGMSSKEIGRTLEISPKTVDVHRAAIMRKMGVATSSELKKRFQAAGAAEPIQ